MRFKKIKINNIRSYEDAEINLPVGSVLLSGDIGSGKTTILLALEFALFGLQPGQKGTSLLKNGKDDGSVELEFEIDGKEIIISRSLKRKKTVTQESTCITIDGKKQEKSITEIKNNVLTLLNYPQEFAKKTNLLYKFTVYTPQEGMKQIILENPETRLTTLRHIFGVDKYKRIKENTMILISKLKESSKLKQGQILDIDLLKQKLKEKKSLLSELTKQIPEIGSRFLLFSSDIQKKQKEIQEVKEKIEEKKKLESEVEKTNLLLITKKEQIEKLSEQIQEFKTKLEQATKDFNQDRLDNLVEEISSGKQLKEKLNSEIIKLSAEIESLLFKRLGLENLKEKISHLKQCPTCLQQVSQEHKENILNQTQKEINKIDSQKSHFDEENSSKKKLFESLVLRIKELEKSKSSLEEIKIRLQTIEEDSEKYIQLQKQEKNIKKDIEMLSGQIITLRESLLELKKYDNMLIIREKELSEISEKQRNIEIKKAEIAKEIEFGKKDLLNIRFDIEYKENIKKELQYLSELENWASYEFLDMISFIEKNIMFKLKNEFSNLFNEWFSVLVPDIFTTKLDDYFTPVIEQEGYEIDYNYLSGGERTAVALAYRLALNQTINSMLSEIKTKGIVILDEPTDGFSQQQLDKMRDVLAQLNVEQLIIVSHDQKIESFVQNIIRLKKENGISKVFVD